MTLQNLKYENRFKQLGSSEKLVLDKGKVATCEFTKPKQVLLNASKVFKKSGKKRGRL
jgi:hypothetical protein